MAYFLKVFLFLSFIVILASAALYFLDANPKRESVISPGAGDWSTNKFCSLVYKVPVEWKQSSVDTDSASTITHIPPSAETAKDNKDRLNAGIDITYRQWECRSGLRESDCIKGAFDLEPKKTIYNGDSEFFSYLKTEFEELAQYNKIQERRLPSTDTRAVLYRSSSDTATSLLSLIDTNEEVFIVQFKNLGEEFVSQFLERTSSRAVNSCRT